jgi:hypothetical protein
MTPMEEFAREARGWARQTIIFTLQYGLSGVETLEDEHAQVVKLSDESVEIMDRLWAAAAKGSTDLSQVLHAFIRLVLEWCSEHVRAASA